jgi:hypothetical protein
MQKKTSVRRNGLEVKSSKPARNTSSRFEAYADAVMTAILVSSPPSNWRRFRAAQLRQTQIHPDKVRPPLLECLDPECSILGDFHVKAGVRQHLPQDRRAFRIVFDNQNAPFRLACFKDEGTPRATSTPNVSDSFASSSGSSTTKRGPRPTSLSTRSSREP